MARSFRHVAPNRLQIRQGGGILSVFGLPFFGAGIFVTLIAFGLVPVSNAEEAPEFARVALPLLGMVFTMVGGALVFGRSWTTVDGAERLVIKQSGLLVPMHTQTHRLDDGMRVVIGFDAGDSDSADRFPVSLKWNTGRPLGLCSFTEYAESRACAAEVAQVLHVDVEDATTDHPTRVAAGHSDLPLQQRLRLDGREALVSERPLATRIEVSRDRDGIRITIPMPRAHPVAVVATLIPVGISLALLGPLSQFFERTGTPDPVVWAFLGFLIVAFGVLPAGVALNGVRRSRRGATIVTVSTEGIRVENRGAWRTSSRATFEATDILDVDYSTSESLTKSTRRNAEESVPGSSRSPTGPPVIGARTQRMLVALSQFARGRGITIKTRQSLTTLGQGLADEEIRYVHSVVRRALAGRVDAAH